jgi:hypothetical protein
MGKNCGESVTFGAGSDGRSPRAGVSPIRTRVSLYLISDAGRKDAWMAADAVAARPALTHLRDSRIPAWARATTSAIIRKRTSLDSIGL